MFTRLFRPFGPRPATARLNLERCEDREVPASLAYDPGNDTLTVTADADTSDFVRIAPAGASATGSTGVRVSTSLDGFQNRTFGDAANPVARIALDLKGGNDTVLVSNLTNSLVLIGLGNGDNVVRVGNTAGTALIAGSGRNVASLGGGTNNVFDSFASGGAMIGVAAFLGFSYTISNDGIRIAGTVGNDRNNVVAVSAAAGLRSSVDIVGNGSNAVLMGAGDDFVRVVGGGNNVVSAGTGANVLFLQGGGDNFVASLGTGSVTIDGGGRNVVLAGRSPLNSVTLRNAVGFSYIAAAADAAVSVNGTAAGGTGMVGPAFVRRL